MMYVTLASRVAEHRVVCVHVYVYPSGAYAQAGRVYYVGVARVTESTDVIYFSVFNRDVRHCPWAACSVEEPAAYNNKVV